MRAINPREAYVNSSRGKWQETELHVTLRAEDLALVAELGRSFSYLFVFTIVQAEAFKIEYAGITSTGWKGLHPTVPDRKRLTRTPPIWHQAILGWATHP